MRSRKVANFRDAMQLVEENGDLIRIDREVDPLEEVPRVAAQIAKFKPIPMVLFEKIRGYPDWQICGAMFSDVSRTARSLDFPEKGRESKLAYIEALAHPIPPQFVATGPCKENRFLGKIDVEKLIPPHKGTKMVKHKYYQPLVITKNPRVGETNVGIYRSSLPVR